MTCEDLKQKQRNASCATVTLLTVVDHHEKVAAVS